MILMPFSGVGVGVQPLRPAPGASDQQQAIAFNPFERERAIPDAPAEDADQGHAAGHHDVQRHAKTAIGVTDAALDEKGQNKTKLAGRERDGT
jgi:hypothetical protein